MGKLANVLAVALTCAAVAVAADVFRKLGLALYTEQYLAGLLALAMPLLFLHVPADGGKRGREGPVPWYDLVAALTSFAGAVYIAVPLSRAVGAGARAPLGRPGRRGRHDPSHPGRIAAHHRNGPALHHHLLLRAGAGRRPSARRVRRQIDPIRPADLLFRLGFHRGPRHHAQDRVGRRRHLRPVRQRAAEIGRSCTSSPTSRSR